MKRSRPIEPETLQAITRRIERGNITGFMLAVPAIMKFQLRNAPKNAEMPVKSPRISAAPTAISPRTISFPNQE